MIRIRYGYDIDAASSARYYYPPFCVRNVHFYTCSKIRVEPSILHPHAHPEARYIHSQIPTKCETSRRKKGGFLMLTSYLSMVPKKGREGLVVVAEDHPEYGTEVS